ncbi:hypothetical protein Ccrd_018544, partial [Cynara cardunculus var. scolymus]
MHQKPQVRQGKCIKKGQILAYGAATVGGELALGKNETESGQTISSSTLHALTQSSLSPPPHCSRRFPLHLPTALAAAGAFLLSSSSSLRPLPHCLRRFPTALAFSRHCNRRCSLLLFSAFSHQSAAATRILGILELPVDKLASFVHSKNGL